MNKLKRLKRFLKSLVAKPPHQCWPDFNAEDLDSLADSLFSPDWGGEPELSKFAEVFCAFINAKFGVPTNSGTSALEIAVQALGIKAGDEVIVPAYTFYSTASAVLKAGATPVFVDVTLHDGCIAVEKIEAAISAKTRAIIVVHLAGHPVDFMPILSISDKHNLPIIEDVAHATGSEWQGRKVGAIGNIGCFSFQSGKTLTAGEGGFIATNDANLHAVCQSLVNLGRPYGGNPSEHHVLGGNYRLSKIQAAILLIQLKKFDQQWKKRDDSARVLRERLSTISGLTPFRIASYATRVDHSYFAFSYAPEHFGGVGKPELIAKLNDKGVPVFGGYSIPLPEQPVFKALRKQEGEAHPIAKELCNRLLVLPHTFLLQPTQTIVDAVTRISSVQQSLQSQRQ